MPPVNRTAMPENPQKRLTPKEIADQATKILEKQGSAAMKEFLDTQNALPQTPPEGSSKKKDWRENARLARENGAVPPVTPIADDGELSEDIQKLIQKSPVDHTLVPTYRPNSIRDAVSILQPKSVLFAKYALSEWQEDIITLIMEQLQGYMSTSLTALKYDVLGELVIRIDSSDIAGDDKKGFIETVNKMMTLPFEFWWQSAAMPEGTQKIETKGVVISTYHNYIGTSYVDLVINRWAIPFLLYYGKGVGATRYLKRTALALSGKYSKKLYKIISGYIDKGSFEYPIDRLRKEFDIPDTYSTGAIKRSVINPALVQINSLAEGFSISAEFITKYKEKYTSKRKPFDTIIFTISSTRNQEDDETNSISEDEKALKVQVSLSPLLAEPYKSRLFQICETWKRHGDIGFAYSKVVYYEKQYKKGLMSHQKMKNFLIKALEEETKIQLHSTKKKSVSE